MAEIKEVFISYHEKSAGELVRKLADRLEGAGISCWYASRDLLPGEDFAKHIPEQINNCKVFLFILNEGANTSEHMGNEMGLAFRRKDKGLAIIPYQVEKCDIAPWLADYYLVRIQIQSSERMDASALVTEVAHKLGREPAKNGDCGPGAIWTYKNSVLTISLNQYNGNGEMGDFYWQNIPKGINTPWWSEHEKITSVIIENGVTNIGQYAFFKCKNLTKVSIPESVTDIGDCAFNQCSSLTSVDIPNSVIHIGYFAFLSCRTLISVNIPDSVALIGAEAFADCHNLKSVSVPTNALISGDAFASYTEVIRRPPQ